MVDPLKSWAIGGFAAAFFLPLCSFLFHLSPKKRTCNGIVAAVLIAASFFCMLVASWLWLSYVENPVIRPLKWITLPSSMIVSFSLDFSPPILVLSGCTLFVSACVHLYSIPYIRDSENTNCYFGILGLFTSSMLGLFWSTNLWGLFLFWSLIGICSYVLIGHNYKRSSSATAAQTAMLFSKSADVGLIIGLAVLSAFISKLDIHVLQAFFRDPLKQQFPLFNFRVSMCGLLFVWAAFGKSAQFPFQPWLLAAMRAPTPVSALLHSATLVVAGVFLLARMSFLFTPWLRDVLLIMGLATALFAALSACVQTHNKRLLAYSTISQLGFMMSLVALGQIQYAFTYLVIHAVSKALLFLAMGVIVRRLSVTTSSPEELPQMGGLWRSMPLPYVSILFGSAVLLGLPLSASYLLKSQLIAQFWGYGSWTMLLALLSIFCTGLYVGRILGYLFLTKAETQPTSLRVWQQPALQLPLLLGSLGCLAFFYQYPTQNGEGWLIAAMQQAEGMPSWAQKQRSGLLDWIGWLPLLAALLGAAFVKYFSSRKKRSGPLASLLYHHGYLEQLYKYLWQGVQKTSQLFCTIEKRFFTDLGKRVAQATLLLALALQFVDTRAVGGGLRCVAKLLYITGQGAASIARQRLPLRISWALILGLSALWLIFWLLY